MFYIIPLTVGEKTGKLKVRGEILWQGDESHWNEGLSGLRKRRSRDDAQNYMSSI